MSAPRRPIPVRIAGTGSLAPGPARSTAEIAAQLTPRRDPVRLQALTGIASRHFADEGEMPSALGARVLRDALDMAGMEPQALARIIMVSSGGGEVILPPTANLIAARLGLAGTCDCFDLNNGCMGFLTAFDIAARGIATGGGPVGIAVVELSSRVITPTDPRPYVVFGDGVAGAVLRSSHGEEGVLGVWLRNDGVQLGNVRLLNPLGTGKPETIRFTAPNVRMLEEALDAVRTGTQAVLAEACLTLDDVQWVLPHQPNGVILDALIAALGVDADRVIPVAHEVGSVGSASIPMSLDRLLRTRDVHPGDRILMVGVGAGISFGAILYQVGA
jgi:3-oxoacyl-(acyl-carrier-protein) synthase III